MKKVCLLLLSIMTLNLSAIDLSLQLQADYYGDLEPTTDYANLRSRLYAKPEISGVIFGYNLEYFLTANLYYQPIGDETFVQLDNILREGFIGLHTNLFSLYLGQRFVNWGKVDFYSPMNIINPVNTTVLSLDSLDEGKLPVLMADLFINLGFNASLEVVYEPYLRTYYYPEEQLDIIMNNAYVDVDATFYHKTIPYLSKEAHSLFLAYNYWSYWFDLLLSYSYFIDQYPDFDLSGITQEYEGTKPVIRGEAFNTYNRAHLIGIGFGMNLQDWGIDLESGLKITEDWNGTKVETKNSELVNNFQVNRTFFNNLFIQFNIIYRYIINFDATLDAEYSSLIMSYLKSEMKERFLQPAESSVYIVNHIHRNFINDTLQLALNSGIGFPVNYSGTYETEVYLAPRVSYSLNDFVKIQSGADLYIQGEEAGYLGRNTYKDNFYIRVVLNI